MKKYNDMYDEPWNRSIILLQDECGYNRLLNDDQGKELFRKNGLIVLKLEDREYEKEFKILGENKPTIGSLLALNSHTDHTYIDITEAKSVITQERYSLMMELLQLLGAKRITLKSISIQEIQTGIDATLNVESHIIGGNLAAQHSTLKKLAKSMTMINSFQGEGADLVAAKNFLEQNKLSSNSHMRHLFNIASNTNNKIQQYNLKLETTESINKIFDIATSIQWPLNTISLSTATAFQESNSYILDIDIKF